MHLNQDVYAVLNILLSPNCSLNKVYLFIVDTLYNTISRYLSRKKTPKRQGSLLFPGTKGKTIGGTRVRQMIMEAAERIGITARVTPHVFRHTFATDMYNQGIPIEAIQEMMGQYKNCISI